jgi:hypothetical protein
MFKFNDLPVGYTILDDGYDIYLNGKLWITQRVDGYIPYRDIDPNADLETCCLKQIEDICTAQDKPKVLDAE